MLKSEERPLECLRRGEPLEDDCFRLPSWPVKSRQNRGRTQSSSGRRAIPQTEARNKFATSCWPMLVLKGEENAYSVLEVLFFLRLPQGITIMLRSYYRLPQGIYDRALLLYYDTGVSIKDVFSCELYCFVHKNKGRLLSELKVQYGHPVFLFDGTYHRHSYPTATAASPP